MFRLIVCDNIKDLECKMRLEYKKVNISRYPIMFDMKEYVEREFERLIKDDGNVFRDRFSKKIMRKIDHSRYVGKYEIKTPYGRTIVTSLCSGVKLALLLEYYRKKNLPVYTIWERAGDNIWEYLGKSDKVYTIYLDVEDCIYRWVDFKDYILDFDIEQWNEYFRIGLYSNKNGSCDI